MIEELISLLALRLQDVFVLLAATSSRPLLTFTIVKFQFQQHLRKEQQKKIITSLSRIPEQQVADSEVRQRIISISDKYRPIFRQYGVASCSSIASSSLIEHLKTLSELSLQSVENIRYTIAKQYPISWGIHLKMNLTADKFRTLLHQYGQSTGLSAELTASINYENQGTTLSEIVADASKANIRISKAIKEYEELYKGYKRGQKKKKLKKVLSTEQPQKAIEIKLQKISPLKKYVSEYRQRKSVSPSKKQSNKAVVKMALPQALKRIQFPNISTTTHKASYIHSFIRKKQSRKSSTVPSQQISTTSKDVRISCLAEKISYSTAIYDYSDKEVLNNSGHIRLHSIKRLHNIASLISNANDLSILRVKRKEEHLTKPKKAENSVCFNDEIMKKDLYQKFSIDTTFEQC